MSDAWDDLTPILRKLADLRHGMALLGWDMAVMMPPKGAPARARASATLQVLFHETLTASATGEAIARLSETDSLAPYQAATVVILKRDFEKATKVPARLVRDLAELSGLAYQAWTEARPASDFAILQPHLERMIELKKEEADALGWEEERYDALLDDFEPGLTARKMEGLFADLISGLKPMAETILEAAGSAPAFVTRSYDPSKQEAFCQWLVEQLRFDTEAGRLDKSPHPFTSGIAAGDTRQTIRTLPKELLGSIYAAIHETGHALYEQGLPEEWSDLPVGSVPSLGMHESQSRLWENHIGRHRAFTDFMLPHLKERFPEELGMLEPNEFYEGVNHPERTLIRVAADEVTYNLHVALRFELELALFRDELQVADLPDAWNAGMEKHLNVRPENDGEGVLQDMHWPDGYFGYFPTYSLGTLYAAAFFARAQDQLGPLGDELRAGDTERLLDWMRREVHARAYLYPATELGEMVLGASLTADPFLDYIRTKYGELYSLEL